MRARHGLQASILAESARLQSASLLRGLPPLPVAHVGLRLGAMPLQHILENEFGGMSEALTTLHVITDNGAYLR